MVNTRSVIDVAAVVSYEHAYALVHAHLLRAPPPAYVDARYSLHHKITPEDLDWIGERVAVLQVLVGQVCGAGLSALGSQSAAK